MTREQLCLLIAILDDLEDDLRHVVALPGPEAEQGYINYMPAPDRLQ